MKKYKYCRPLLAGTDTARLQKYFPAMLRKFFPLFAGMMVLVSFLQAQPVRRPEKIVVPYQTQEAFSGDFPGARNVTWNNDIDDFTEVSFVSKEGKEMTAFYDDDNTLAGTQWDVPLNEIPAAGIKKIKKDYKDYIIVRAVYFDDNEANENDFSFSGTLFDKDDYYVVLNKGTKNMVVQVTPDGDILYEANIK